MCRHRMHPRDETGADSASIHRSFRASCARSALLACGSVAWTQAPIDRLEGLRRSSTHTNSRSAPMLRRRQQRVSMESGLESTPTPRPSRRRSLDLDTLGCDNLTVHDRLMKEGSATNIFVDAHTLSSMPILKTISTTQVFAGERSASLSGARAGRRKSVDDLLKEESAACERHSLSFEKFCNRLAELEAQVAPPMPNVDETPSFASQYALPPLPLKSAFTMASPSRNSEHRQPSPLLAASTSAPLLRRNRCFGPSDLIVT